MSKLFIPSPYLTNKENDQIADRLDLNRKNNPGSLQGEVAVLHETKDGKRELLPPTSNHIVLCGRRWLMQAGMNQNYNSTIQQKDWTVYWFGVGSGGALDSAPAIPLDTADNTTDLLNPIIIQPTSNNTGGIYSSDGYKKNLYRADTDTNWVSMIYSETRGEVMMLAQLQLTYDDCPYTSANMAASINELGLYASASSAVTETNWVLFSRYCRPTIFKTSGDSYSFLWYVYF
jgi:hypothetical protein